jgi:Fibronectin type III domain
LACLVFGVGFAGLAQTEAAQSVFLAWDPAPGTGVIGYRLHCGTTSHVYTQQIELGKTTAVVLSNLVGGKTYFFAVTDYNAAFQESAPSNEVSYTVPVPPQTPTAIVTQMQGGGPRISLSAGPTTITKGQIAGYTIRASRIKTTPLTIHYVMRGTAVVGTDYTLSGKSGQITLRAGRSSATIRLTSLKTPRTKGSLVATMYIMPGPGYTVVPMAYKAGVTIDVP